MAQDMKELIKHTHQKEKEKIVALENFANALAELVRSMKSGDETSAQDLARIDQVIGSADEQERSAIEGEMRRFIADVIRNDPKIIPRMVFASGLIVRPVSPFFAALLRILAEEDEKLSVPEMWSLVVTFRREGLYEQMERCAELFSRKTKDDVSTDVRIWRSKVSYELHMALYQQATTSDTQEKRQELLERSRSLADKSATEALLGGDPVGRLYALMNVSGLILPALGQLNESVALSEQVCKEAEEQLQHAQDGDARNRINRVIMNSYAHRLRTGLEQRLESSRIKALYDAFLANPVYKMSMVGDEHPQWAKSLIEAVRAFLD